MATEQTAKFGPRLVRKEAELGERLRRGERGAFAELYDLHAPRALAVAMRILGDRQLAEDTVHDAFAWIWEHADRLDDRKGPPEALLLVVTRRRALDRRRSGGRRNVRERLSAGPDRIDDEALDIVAALDREQLTQAVREQLASLSEQQREAVELAYFGGLTQAAIAERQHVPLGTVKSRIRSALDRLREALGDHHADL